MTKLRVVVTGMGMLTPLGNDVASSWQALQQGKSGVDFITHFDTELVSESYFERGQYKRSGPWAASFRTGTYS